MEKILDLIKNNLTGNYDEDMEFLNSLYEEENKIIENANATIEAINIVTQEIEDGKYETTETDIDEEKVEDAEKEATEEELEKRAEQETEIDNMIDTLFQKMAENDGTDLLPDLENIITKIESLSSVSNENEIHCSFSTDFEKMIFEKIFAGDKKIVITPYKNDVLYIMYADMLLEKKRKTAALDALNRAIYWNFLNREAREKKLEILHGKNQIVKYLENLKVLQQISYTAEDLAHVYNLYAEIFDELKDKKAAYGMYKISNYYYPNDEVENIVRSYEEDNPEFKELTDEDIIVHVTENEVQIGPSLKIVKAHRDITADFINAGKFEDAKIMLENDYNLTKDEQIADVYDQVLVLIEQEEEEKPKKKTTRKKKVEESKDVVEKESEEKKKTTRKKKTEKAEEDSETKEKKTKKTKSEDEKTDTKKVTKKTVTKKAATKKETKKETDKTTKKVAKKTTSKKSKE